VDVHEPREVEGTAAEEAADEGSEESRGAAKVSSASQTRRPLDDLRHQHKANASAQAEEIRWDRPKS